MIASFTIKIGRREVDFSRHAVARYRERVCPELSRKAAREHLKVQLREGRYVEQPESPPWVRSGFYSRAICRGYLVVGDFACFPLARNLDGRWAATTCMFRIYARAA